jgi:type II secretory pathway pseudopilin PulG
MRWLHRDERGTTLVELLVMMVLISTLGMVLVTAFAATTRSSKVGEDESQGLSDTRTVIERLGRDIRDARGVTCDGTAPDTTCQSHLQLWVDYNSNYKIDTSTEVVTWQLQSLGDGHHYKVVRTVGGVSTTIATSLIVQVAFSYDQAPTNANTSPTRTVTTSMTYDALYGLGAGSRDLTFTERVRNVA